MKKGAVQESHVKNDSQDTQNIPILQMEDIELPLESPPKTDTNEIGILQMEDIVEQPFNIARTSTPKLNESDRIQQLIGTFERQHELLQTTVKSHPQLCQSEHLQEKDFRTNVLPRETYEHMQQHIVSTVPQPHSSKAPERVYNKTERDQTHTYENKAATSFANSQDSRMTGNTSFVPCYKNTLHLSESTHVRHIEGTLKLVDQNSGHDQTNSGLEEVMVVHHSQAPLTHEVTNRYLQDHQKTESSSNVQPRSTQIHRHNEAQNNWNLNQTRPQHHLSRDQMYYVNSSHQYMRSGLLGTPPHMNYMVHLLAPLMAHLQQENNSTTYTEPIQFQSHSVKYYQHNQEHIYRNVYNRQQNPGQMQNSHSIQQNNQFGPHGRHNMNFPKLHVPQPQLRREIFSVVYQNVGHLSNSLSDDVHCQNFTNTDNDFNSNTTEIDLQATSDRQLINIDAFNKFDDIKDTKTHSGRPKALNELATQDLMQNHIRRKLAPQQPHVHQVQAENRHLQSQCLEGNNTEIMPRARPVYKKRKLTTHETKQHEQPSFSAQLPLLDLNPLQRQSVLQYPTATTKMAPSNIHSQPDSAYSIIFIVPKDSQQIFQVQDFLLDSGHIDLGKIKEHASSFCRLPNGRRVSLEFFHKMLKYPNKHSLGDKIFVEILNNKQQCTVVEHQRANNSQQARITTREIKPSEVHQFLIFNDDSSKPQVQMPILKHLTAEEFKHLQPNQENDVSHHKNLGFSSTLENPNPLSSSQRSLEDHTISSSTLHMKNWPTLKMNRGVVSSFVYTITPPSAVEDQKPINPQSLKNFEQHAINLEQYQNKQFYNKLQQVQGTVLQNIPLESAAQYQYIKNINQDVQQQAGQPKKNILTVDKPRENIMESVSADGQINIAKQSTIKTLEKKHGRMQRFEGKMGSDNSAVNDETKKSSKIMILESKPTMLKIKEIITLSSSDEEDHENSNCKDFFTTKQDANTFQNNILDLVVAVSAHKEKPKDDSDRETVIERISKMTRAGSTRIQEPNLSVALECRTVIIGTYKTIPIGNIIISSKSIKIRIPASHRGKQLVDLEIDKSEIVDIKGYLGRSVPIIFFRTKCSSGEKIRRCLNMTEAGPYFDPDSQDQSHKRIVLLPKQLDEASKKTFKKIFTRSFLHITKREANQLLLLSSPKEVLPVSKADKPQEQPKLIISKILTYPPPPAKGGLEINTQDFMCLAPETYINDIIIDFFFIYLIETLSPELREKIHIMGTYFYNKLTQRRAAHVFPEETDALLTPAERRHCRVKGWTKKVDLFTKDFIFIPINEMQHWFLAVVCFPGLTGENINTNTVTRVSNESTEKSIPQSKKKDPAHKISKVKLHEVSNNRDEADGAESEMEDEVKDSFQGEIKEPATDNNLKNIKKSKLKTTGGTPIDKSFKQPCILIFDSMPTYKRTKVVATLREYLEIEYRVKYYKERKFTRETMKGSTPSVPLQDNLTDCGLFTLQYAESFLKKPVVDFHLPITSLKNMFPLEAAKSKRSEIQQIIYKILLETKANIDDLNLPFYYPMQVDTEEKDNEEVASSSTKGEEVASSSTKGEEVASSSTKGEEVASNRTQDGNKSYNGGVGSDSMKTKKTISQDTMSKPKTCKISSEVSHITIPNGKKIAGTPKTESPIPQNRYSSRIYLKTKRLRSVTNEAAGEITEKKKRKI